MPRARAWCGRMKTSRLFAIAALFAAALAPAQAGFFDEIKGDLTGPKVEGSPKYTALYFSAHWCPPCRMFTPKLVEWYKEFKKTHPNFELVFVSSDRSEGEMEEYIKEAGMPWPAVAYDKTESPVFTKLSSDGIPYLVLVDDSGKPVTAKPDNEWQSPDQVLEEIAKIVPAGS